MKVPILLALLCAAVVVYDAEAGWLPTILRWVSGFVRSVTVRADFGKRRLKRELKDELSDEEMKEVNTICKENHIDVIEADGLPFEVVQMTFDELDAGKNYALDEKELKNFVSTLDVYLACMQEAKPATSA